MAETIGNLTETQKDDEPVDESEDPDVPWRQKVTLFLFTYWRGLVCLIVPFIIIPVLVPFPPKKHQWCAYTLLLMSIFWVTECIPLPVTSFLPIVIFPLTDVMDTQTTCKCYMNLISETDGPLILPHIIMRYLMLVPNKNDTYGNSVATVICTQDTIMMFLGSMALAYAVEQSGLHKRLALYAIRLIGYSHYRLLFGLSITTMFISMWITNTAATTLMVPIIFALLQVFEDQDLLIIYERDSNDEMIASDITTCYFCATSFSATIGGIGTLVGTATNLVFKGLFQRAYLKAPEYLSFPKFSAFTIPYMLLLEAGLYFCLIVIYFGFLRPNSTAAQNAKISAEGVQAAKNAVEENWKKLGKITFWEIMVTILFSGAILLFFFRSPQIFYGWGDNISDSFKLNDYQFVRDSAAALLVCFLMFLLPSTLDIFLNCSAKTDTLPDKQIPSVLNWVMMNKVMPYSFTFLLGGGFALSEAAKKEYSDLNGQIGSVLKNLDIFPNYFIILLLIIFTIFITNFASNVAVCNVITPIVMQLAREINIHPLWYNIASGIPASFCFCLPVGTPGNLVIQSAANIPTMKMVKAGVGPTVTTILLSFIMISFWAPVIWSDLNKYTDELSWIE